MEERSALIAMSGGVDSSVAAHLMLQAGYRCMGVNMRLYHNEDIGVSIFRPCCSQQDRDDAASAAERLGMPFEVRDFTADFKQEVIDKFIRTYEQGGTPNPCIDCNRRLKFAKLLDFAREKGMNYLVTGHYARVEYDAASGRYLLRKAMDLTKDQSYVLYTLTQEQLAHIRFPLGELTGGKQETRQLAAGLGLGNARKAESQDICFVPDGDYVAFMEHYTGRHYDEGDFLDTEGRRLGRHRGAVRYTIGQRRGLGLAAAQPLYVCAKDMAANTVTVGRKEALYTRELCAADMNWIAVPEPENPLPVLAKTRYRQQEQPATAYPEPGGRMRLVFDDPQRAITPGQAVVMYRADGSGVVVGGGTIERAVGK